MLRRSFSLSLCLALASVAAAAQERIALTFPVACALGETCVIQNFVDRDDGPGFRDYRCGAMTYDGHNGTDIRLPTLAAMRAGVNVLAAADGVVLRLRDGEQDISMRDPKAVDIAGRECGNAVLIDHGGGWVSQYCHLKRWSVKVNPGSRVRAGQVIGQIGLSGRTEFPHLHFTLRRNGRVIDPQAPASLPAACGDGGDGGDPLWTDVAPQALYRDRFILDQGFADGPVTTQELDAGIEAARRPAPRSPAVLAYVRAIGLHAGDAQHLALIAPDGATLAETKQEPLTTPKAVQWLSVGRKRPAGNFWPAGRYIARYTASRGGEIVREAIFQFEMPSGD